MLGASLQIAIIGCGRVGLVTGGCLATVGHQVICADCNEAVVRALRQGRPPLYEPYLDHVLQENLRTGRLKFTADSSEAVRASDVIFLCVGVPQLEGGDADLSALDAAAGQIARTADSPKLVVERSTVPVQTGLQLTHLLSIYNRNRGGSFRVAASPQFLREGTAVADFLHPGRILVGVNEERSAAILREIYAPILQGKFVCPVHAGSCLPGVLPEFLVTSVQSAELIKHAANAFLSIKISYANVVADLCERLEGNVQEVTRAMGLDPRIGPSLLEAGLGFGGARLPKDLEAFRRLAERAGVDSRMLREAENVNRERIELFFKKIERALWVIRDKQIALLGLAYKSDTDDIRGSRAIELYLRLVSAGARVRAYDPQAISGARDAFPQLDGAADPYSAAERADALVIATDWDEFRRLDWARIREGMARPLVFDARNILSPAQMKSLGFEYHSVGRPD